MEPIYIDNKSVKYQADENEHEKNGTTTPELKKTLANAFAMIMRLNEREVYNIVSIAADMEIGLYKEDQDMGWMINYGQSDGFKKHAKQVFIDAVLPPDPNMYRDEPEGIYMLKVANMVKNKWSK